MTDWRSSDGKNAMAEVLALLDLEAIDGDTFRGLSPQGRIQRVFGGQVLGQALIAATRTVDVSRICHSLHAYFLRPGDPRVPILYEVDRSRDGHSFSARRVAAIQHGKQIFILAASFQKPEQGYEHQDQMPDVPPPEALEDETEARRRHADRNSPEFLREWLTRARPFETRPVILDPPGDRPARPPRDNVWFRAAAPLPRRLLQQALRWPILAFRTRRCFQPRCCCRGEQNHFLEFAGCQPGPCDVVSPPVPFR